MKAYKILYLLVVCICLISCAQKDDSGRRRVEWTSIKAFNINNANNTPTILDFGDSVVAKAYGIGVDFEDSTNIFGRGGSVENAQSYESGNPVKAFSIYSLQTFDETHPAGSVLNEYFKVRSGSRKFRTPQLSNAEPLYLQNFGSINDVLLYEMPFKASVYQFVVKVEFANAKVLADTTEPVYLIP